MQKRQYSMNKTNETTENREPGQARWLAYNPARRDKAGGASVQEWFTNVCSGQPGLHEAH